MPPITPPRKPPVSGLSYGTRQRLRTLSTLSLVAALATKPPAQATVLEEPKKKDSVVDPSKFNLGLPVKSKKE